MEKYSTRLSASINADTESLVLSMAEAILDPNSDVPSYKVLELAIDMQKVPTNDMCDLFQTVCDMIKDKLMQLTLALTKLEQKHDQLRASFVADQVSFCANAHQVRDLQDQIKNSDEGGKGAQAALIKQLQKEVASAKR